MDEKTLENAQQTTEYCVNCDMVYDKKTVATHYCITCVEFLCDDCWDIHEREYEKIDS